MSLSEKLDAWTQRFDQDNRENIARVNTIYTQAVREVLSVPGDHEHPSKPGQAPHEVTGELLKSITGGAERATSTTKATAPYAVFLVKVRPFWRIAYERVKPQIEQILLRKL